MLHSPPQTNQFAFTQILFREDRRLQFLGVWLLGILITLSQNKDMMNGEHSDSDYSSDEEDRYPTSNLSIPEETKLQQHLIHRKAMLG